MLYWNKDNYVGVEQFAGALREDSQCVDFADYCELKNKGLRKQAFESLRAFLKAFDAWSDGQRREWSHGLMGLRLEHPEVDDFITHPLRETLIPVFEKWAEEELSNASPCRWLGVLTPKAIWDEEALTPIEWFVEALVRDDGDQYSRSKIGLGLIDEAEFMCHHIPGYFLGEPEDASRCLDQAEDILAPISDLTRWIWVIEELNLVREKLNDWCDFQASNYEDFDEWCKHERGHVWERPMIVYYGE